MGTHPIFEPDFDCLTDHTMKLLTLLLAVIDATAVKQLSAANRAEVLAEDKISFVNFYADWCRFSRQLHPIFDAAASAMVDEQQIVFGRVDCDREQALCKEFAVNKYPTIKLFRHGKVLKKEYRGTRSVDAIKAFLLEQIRDPVQKVTSLEQLNDLTHADKRTKSQVVGYFESEDSDEFRNFQVSGDELVESCQFYAAIGDMAKPEMKQGANVVFKNKARNRVDRPFYGKLADREQFKKWVDEQCVPLVREITFNNAEEITEEGLPLMILFHKREATKDVDQFTQAAQRWLFSQKGKINIVTAQAEQFSHPLYHLGKQLNDCPVIAIDSFSHMYIFKKPFEEIVRLPHLLTFANDLHSGKLHREFHHGPDPESEEAAAAALEEAKKIEEQIEEVKDEIEEVKDELQETSEKLDDKIDENIEKEDDLEAAGSRVEKMRKQEDVKEAKKVEEELYQKEDKLYEVLDEKEEKLDELEEKKQEKLEEAKAHMESKGTPPPESQFKKLAPNDRKYTIVDHDEL